MGGANAGNAAQLTSFATPQWGQQGAYGSAVDQEMAQSQAQGQDALQAGMNQQGSLNAQGQQYQQQFGALGQQYANQGQQNYAQNQQALGMAQQAAQGNGPSGAGYLLQQGTQAGQNAQMSAAASARGNAQANAFKQAQQAGATQYQNAANAAGQLKAQEMQQGEANYLQGSQASMAQQQAASQGMLHEGAQAGLGYQQLGQQAYQSGQANNLAYQGQGIGVQNQAQESWNQNYAAALGVAQSNAANQSQQTGAAIGAGATMAAAMADAKMQEPGGQSAWTLREEPDFILAKNDRTGELRKVATEPLSHEEHAQALAPHGAGPINGQAAHAQPTYGDMAFGGTPTPADLGPTGQGLGAAAAQHPSMQSAPMPSQPGAPTTQTMADAHLGSPSYEPAPGGMPTLGPDLETRMTALEGEELKRRLGLR